MRQIATEIFIRASPATVWGILMDFASYPDWNPFVRYIAGQAQVGEPLKVSVYPAGKPYHFKPVVKTLEPEKAFAWRGSGAMGTFNGYHYFRLREEKGGTRLLHGEEFSGLLVPLVFGTMREKTEEGFRAMNQALKARAEGA